MMAYAVRIIGAAPEMDRQAEEAAVMVHGVRTTLVAPRVAERSEKISRVTFTAVRWVVIQAAGQAPEEAAVTEHAARTTLVSQRVAKQVVARVTHHAGKRRTAELVKGTEGPSNKEIGIFRGDRVNA
jgi:hypothetical protein